MVTGLTEKIINLRITFIILYIRDIKGPKGAYMSFFKEFKTFIQRGNVVDMATGIVIGAAFGKIVNSLVNDILMPPLGMLIHDNNFNRLRIVLKEAVTNSEGEIITQAVAINYGTFIQVVLNFLIISFAIFLLIKGVNELKRKEEAKPVPPPKPTIEEELLTEIRDLLKEKG